MLCLGLQVFPPHRNGLQVLVTPPRSVVLFMLLSLVPHHGLPPPKGLPFLSCNCQPRDIPDPPYYHPVHFPHNSGHSQNLLVLSLQPLPKVLAGLGYCLLGTWPMA